MAVGDTYRVRHRGRLRGARVETGYYLTAAQAPGDPSDAAGAAVAVVQPLLDAATSVEVNWDEIIISDVEPTGSEQVVMSLTQPHPGLVAGECLPNQATVVMGLRTGQKGGRHRGRMYIPGISESNHALGRVTGTQLTAIQALGAGLVSNYGPTGGDPDWRLQIYSPEDLTPPPVKVFKPRPGTRKTQVTSTDVDDLVASQRRRRPGTGI
jgi:hypothetical protein